MFLCGPPWNNEKCSSAPLPVTSRIERLCLHQDSSENHPEQACGRSVLAEIRTAFPKCQRSLVNEDLEFTINYNIKNRMAR